MKIIIGIMAFITILVVILLFATPLLASDYRCCSDTYITEEYITNVNETTTISNTYEDNFNDNALSRGIAIGAAMVNLPELSHVGHHGHSGVSVAIGSYHSDQALAIGYLHQHDKYGFKTSIGLSGSERIIGAGASFRFK